MPGHRVSCASPEQSTAHRSWPQSGPGPELQAPGRERPRLAVGKRRQFPLETAGQGWTFLA